MTDAAFADLSAGWPPAPGDVGVTNGAPDTDALGTAADRLAGICEYLNTAKEPTAAENIEKLLEFLQKIEGYLSNGPAGSKGFAAAINALIEKLRDVRLHTRTVLFMASEWEGRALNKDTKLLGDIGADFEALLKKQDELESSLANFVNQLLRVPKK